MLLREGDKIGFEGREFLVTNIYRDRLGWPLGIVGLCLLPHPGEGPLWAIDPAQGDVTVLTTH